MVDEGLLFFSFLPWRTLVDNLDSSVVHLIGAI